VAERGLGEGKGEGKGEPPGWDGNGVPACGGMAGREIGEGRGEPPGWDSNGVEQGSEEEERMGGSGGTGGVLTPTAPAVALSATI